MAEETFAEVDAVSVTAEAEAEMEAWAADVATGELCRRRERRSAVDASKKD